MSIDWNIVSQIATTVGSAIAAASFASGFYLYFLNQRDERIRKLRDNLTTAKNLARSLDRLLTFETGYELFHAVAMTASIKYILATVFDRYFAPGAAPAISISHFLKTDMPMIGTSIHSPIVESFEERLDLLQLQATRVHFDHPGVARVIEATYAFMENTITAHKRLMREEDAWSGAIEQLFEDANERAKITSVEVLLLALEGLFIGTSQKILRDHHQATINDSIRLLGLIVDAYLAKRPGKLRALSRFERKVKMMPADQTENIDQYLAEAESCFRTALSQDELLKYRELVTRIRQRRPDVER